MRRIHPRLVLTAVAVLTMAIVLIQPPCLPAQEAKDETAIRTVLEAQVAAWNRSDIPAFMESYENSIETTFIGKNIAKGYGPILERYKKNYSTHEQMGTLTFHDIDIRMLPTTTGVTEYAIVTGHFHLDRTTHGEAAKDDGIFSLLWHKTATGWKIILDHTS
jgi:ketosteroid isomerase-like protein